MKKFSIFFVVLSFFFSLFLAELPRLLDKLNSANFTLASATLSNSRFSYRAGVSGTPAAGATETDIDTTLNPDNNTNHLFPNDTVCFPNAAESGCKGQTTYTVSNITDSDTFTFTPGLAGALLATDLVVATQSGSLTLAFTTINEVPLTGDILITIPAVNTTGLTCDGIPDTASTVATNGFDLSTVAKTDLTVTGCTDGNWDVANATVTCGTASTDHTIMIPRVTTACAAGTAVTVVIDSTPGIINPAPINSGHSQGTADIYAINVKTRDGSDATLDQINAKVAPIEGVLVSATVDETLSLTVAGITADSGTYCNITRSASSPDATAYSIPWGTIPSTYAAATHNAAQQLTVSTNALSGYKVYIEENDQMGKDGNVCTGATPSAGNYTFSAGTCIRDTACGVTPCTHTTSQDWIDMATYVGFGYSLDHQSGTDSKFNWDDTGTWQAKQLADQEAPEVKTDANAEIMTNTGPVSGSSIYVCYRIAITGLQPAGYYYNKVKYTAVPKF